MPSLCCACETDIALRLKNSLDVSRNLVQGGEMSEAGELIEIALDVTLNPNTPFPFTCKNCYQFILNIDKKHSKNKEKFGRIRNQTKAKYFRTKS